MTSKRTLGLSSNSSHKEKEEEKLRIIGNTVGKRGKWRIGVVMLMGQSQYIEDKELNVTLTNQKFWLMTIIPSTFYIL